MPNLTLKCPVCDQITDDFFIYCVGYIVCSYECADTVKSYFNDNPPQKFPDLNLPKEICTNWNCYKEIDDQYVKKYGNKYCSIECFNEWKKSNGYDEILSL